MYECWEGGICPLLGPLLFSPTSHPGNRAVTPVLTWSESINTLTPRALSQETWAVDDSSAALQPLCFRQCWHMTIVSAGPRGAGFVCVGSRVQSHSAGLGIEPVSWAKANNKKTGREEGREQGTDEERVK